MNIETLPINISELAMSDLKGSEKQCNWANKIREGKITELLAVIAATVEAKKDWDEGCVKQILEPGDFMEPLILDEKTALEILKKIESANFWIDVRGMKVKDFYSVSGMVTDLISAVLKLVRDAETPLDKLNGYDAEMLRNYLGKDYHNWFAERGIKYDGLWK